MFPTWIDPSLLVRFGVAVLLLFCVLAFLLMRDRGFAPPRTYRMNLACPLDQQLAVVDVVEQRRSGLQTRRVQWCSHRNGRRCREQCVR